jgi:hypothetical protein
MKSLSRVAGNAGHTADARCISPPRTKEDSNDREEHRGAAGGRCPEDRLASLRRSLRKDIRQQKAGIMGAVMLLSAEDAAKFWPIYNEYDPELTKLNDQRVENIKECARTYNQMTDERRTS